MDAPLKKADPIAVRPKSTHRKQRSNDLQRGPLEPVQDRSRRRNEEIIEAAGRLLNTVNIEDLSHSDIAREAGVSKASIHYHFPTMAAIQLELGRRYDEELSTYLAMVRPSRTELTWQEVVRRGAELSRDWFNRHRAACETLLGPVLTRENRLAGMQYNTTVGAIGLRTMQQRFVLPDHPSLEMAISHNGEILDHFWSGSYLRHGHITDEALRESVRASLGYLRNFIPEYLPLRPPGKRA